MKAASPTFWELARQALSSTRRGYDLLAPKFDSTPYATPSDMIEASLQRVCELYPLKSDAGATRGLDLACGTGRASLELRGRVDEVTGIDFSPGMLEQARMAGRKMSGIQWLLGDLEEVELPQRLYDRIVTFGAWGHILPHFREHLLRQILQALRPGGVFLTLTADDPKPWERRYWFYLFFDLAIRLRNRLWFDEFHMYYRLNSTERLRKQFQHLASPEFRISTQPLVGFPELPLTLLTVYRSAEESSGSSDP